MARKNKIRMSVEQFVASILFKEPCVFAYTWYSGHEISRGIHDMCQDDWWIEDDLRTETNFVDAFDITQAQSSNDDYLIIMTAYVPRTQATSRRHLYI